MNIPSSRISFESKLSPIFSFRYFLVLLFFIIPYGAIADVLSKIDVGGDTMSSQSFITTHDDSLAYVLVNYNDKHYSSISVIDVNNTKLVKKVDLPSIEVTDELYLSADGKKLYVAGNGGVAILDVATFKVIKELPFADDSKLLRSAMTPDHQSIYYAVRTHTNVTYNFVKLDMASGNFTEQFINPLNEGANFLFMNFSPDGKTLYHLSNYYGSVNNELYAMNLSTHTDTLLGVLPDIHTASFNANPDGKTFYISGYRDFSNGGGPREIHDYYVYKIDKKTMKDQEISYAEQPLIIQSISADGATLYLKDGNSRRKGVMLMDSKTGAVLKRISSYGIYKAKPSNNPKINDTYFITQPDFPWGNLFVINSVTDSKIIQK